MAFQPIADAEVAPGAPVTSSLFTRVRDNNLLNFQLHTEREAGDIVIGGGKGTASAGTLTDGTVTGTHTAAFGGSYRFTIISGASTTIYRNGDAVSGPHNGAFSVDISGWSVGDEIKLVCTVAVGTGVFSYTIGVSVASTGLYGVVVEQDGIDAP